MFLFLSQFKIFANKNFNPHTILYCKIDNTAGFVTVLLKKIGFN